MFDALPADWRRTAKRSRDARRCRWRHRQAVDQLTAAAREITERCLEDIHTIDDWQRQRPVLRDQLLWMLGLKPLPQRTPLNPVVAGSVEKSGYRLVRLSFESLPGLLVTANFYCPIGVSDPVPCVLYLCGHWPHPLGAKVGFQDRYLWYPAHGFACLVIDPLEFGEVPGIHHGTQCLNLWHWLSLGYTPAAVEVWNAMRALDWLETRPEVDTGRLGATGVSGGGVMTWFLAALDERVAAVAASCSTYTIGSQAAGRLVGSQCDCTFYPNVFGLDFPVVGALVAPRPLLILSGRRDGLFPPAGYHEVYRRVKRVYDLFAGGDSDRIREVDADVGHGDSPLFLHEARRWMRRWVMGSIDGEPDPEMGREPAPAPPETLTCLSAFPPRAANYSIHDHFIRAAPVGVPDTEDVWQQRREALLGELRDRVFRWFPTEPAPFATRTVSNRGDFVRHFANFSELSFDSEPGVPVQGLLFRPKVARLPAPLLVVVKRTVDHVAFPDVDHLLPLLATTVVLIVSPRFSEVTLTPAEFAELERTAAVTGRTVAAMQVWDVVRCVRWALEHQAPSPTSVCVYGRAAAGIVGLYASLFETRINHVVLENPPTSHLCGPAMLTVLRYSDIPEVAGALAPRRLTLLGQRSPAFDLTRRIYTLCNSETRCGREDTLAEALAPVPHSL